MLFKALYGDFKYRSRWDIIKLPIKVCYALYTLPFFLFVIMLSIRTLGAFKGPEKDEKVGCIALLIIHFAGFISSMMAWAILFGKI